MPAIAINIPDAVKARKLPHALAQFILGYQECALWASTDTIDGEESVECDSVNDAEWSDTAFEEILRECKDFLDANRADLDAANIHRPWDHLGHDFFLTRNRHGIGFWDRGLGDVGARLTKAAHVYSTSQPYLGDDRLWYLHG